MKRYHGFACEECGFELEVEADTQEKWDSIHALVKKKHKCESRECGFYGRIDYETIYIGGEHVSLRPLPGRVVIRPRRDDGGSKILWTPDQNPRAVKIHRGEVLAMGEPIHEPDFAIGDEVLFTWEHLEKQWTFDDFVVVPQHCVHAVIELPHETVMNEAPHPWT